MIQPRSNKFQLYCSCATCKLPITTQNIKSHYQKYHIQKEPKSICPCCDAPIFDNKIYCSRSCAAKITNKKKDYSKFKPGPAKGVKPRDWLAYTKIEFCICEICAKNFIRSNATTNSRRFCSQLCVNNYCSTIMTAKLKDAKYRRTHNYGRHKRSWLELSFAKWLTSHSVLFKEEVHFYNPVENKNYYVDFLFEDKNLIIELDGSQHRKTIAADTIRDEYLESIGYHVLRITHAEYTAKTKLQLVKILLGVTSTS